MASNMRAKMRLTRIVSIAGDPTETLTFTAVPKASAYPADGSDEDNTFAKFSPQAELIIAIANPALIGKFAVGETYYVDFTPVPAS